MNESNLLAALDDEARFHRFEDLQLRMPAVWDAMGHDLDDESVVVVPSVPPVRLTPGSGSLGQAYEERFLFLLLLLRQPKMRMIYVTSTTIDPSIIEYYLALLPGVIPSHARRRLHLISVGDLSPRALSEKLLARPKLIAEIAALIPNRAHSHLIPYSTTRLERDLALTLGIPMYGSDPRLAWLGSKTGCRRLFGEVGVPHPLGAEDLHGIDEVATAIESLMEQRPGLRQVIVKLNEGVSGSGNALVELDGVADVPPLDRRVEIEDRVRAMRMEDPEAGFDAYSARLASDGGIVEERIVGEEILSPSVQLRVLPAGTVELLSTHDQLLGGASGQSYLGCVFPADPAYAELISEPAMAIGERLAAEGVLGRFAVDFVVVRDAAGDWSAYAIELNLRKGGTTHPFLTLQFLTDGRYNAAEGRFLTPSGDEKHLVATDHLESPELRSLSIGDLFDAVALQGLHYDHSRQTGIVFHMISSITEHGRVGMTAVGDTAEEAMELYEGARRILLDDARAAGRAAPLPEPAGANDQAPRGPRRTDLHRGL
ncbi:peptide ligase PGM1-related protein [Agromyces sp. NPDC056523]|uniref:peptide ligase PGM1-related protein n=1 Tax=Agromyces sp. NPDC056523 TaxID=3345850 RepID=UPI00366FBA25